MPLATLIVAFASLCVWLMLLFARGNFWRVSEFPSGPALPQRWPRVAAIIPARNESATIAQTVRALADQDYPGEFSIFIVDDHSEDGTASLASRASPARSATALSAPPLPHGWTGKLWALNHGVASVGSVPPDYFWFTDADIVHAPDTLRRLISRAEQSTLDLASLMVLLRAQTFLERALIPPFLYFFLKLYPPRWTANPAARTAGAAGGCILLRRAALERMGGLSRIRSEVIDDCALARAVKSSGGKIWMGLTRSSLSLRGYSTFPQIRDMIARTAFTQLRYSTLILALTLLGLALTYLVPVALLFSPRPLPRILGLASWLLMTISFLPTVRLYRLSVLWAPCLPLAALFYSYSTAVSAVRYWLGRGAQWKGRAQAPRPAA